MKFLLFPFGYLYQLITSLRNTLYDRNILHSFEFSLPVICVGNLRVGGTGKTPMVELLISYFLEKGMHPAIISRGYGRKTRGFRLVDEAENASTVGDEPYQYLLKYGDSVPVAVGEERVFAVPQLLAEHESVNVIVLDDAFQHRKVKATFNIVMSAFDQPFFNDHILPIGRLRESRVGARRADAVIFSRCPRLISAEDKSYYTYEVQKYAGKSLPVFFTTLEYAAPVPLMGIRANLKYDDEVMLVAGLAETRSFEEFVQSNYRVKLKKIYPDHYRYTSSDIGEMIAVLNSQNINKIITTEKDATKLRQFAAEFMDIEVFYLPIKITFLHDSDKFFDELEKSIRQFD